MSDSAENEDEYRFSYSAGLRIFGEIDDLEDISQRLDLIPCHVHRRGEKCSVRAKAYKHDMWIYEAPVAGDLPLGQHLAVLWAAVRRNKDYLLSLKQQCTVDVVCSYMTDCGTGGFEVAPEDLVIFIELGVPFGVSVII